MKNLLVFFLLCTALYFVGCSSERSFFGISGVIYNSLNQSVRPLPKIKLASEGIYRFDICAHDTLFYNTNVQWFCDCLDPKSEGSVDSFAMAFVDEIRVVFFKRPKSDREINLGNPGKETKVGVYYWGFQDVEGGQLSNPVLVVRIKSPKSSNKENDYTDLFFETRGEDLELVEMTYFDKDNSLVNLSRNVKKNKKTGPMAASSKEGMRTIRPKDVFALSEMLYCYAPVPITLKLKGEKVEKIEYAADGSNEFVRTTTLKNADKVLERSVQQKSITTW